MKNQHASFREWLETRPESVRNLAVEFPIGTTFQLKGTTMHLVGYTEDDTLIMSEINPAVNYDGAIAARKLICAEHLREGTGP